MRRILTSVVLLVILFPSLALGEKVKFEDLVERDCFYFKKSSQVFAKGHQLTFTGTVTGPSFECNKATKAVEHAICASRKLSALDRELSKAYKVAKAQLKSGSTDETILLVEQRLWNKERSSRCPKATSKIMEECLATMYGERINQLILQSSENIQDDEKADGSFQTQLKVVKNVKFQMGLDAANKGDYATALKEFRSLSATGHAPAQFELGTMYDTGWGVAKNDEKAIRFYMLAAEQGNSDAQFFLGLKYSRGWDGKQGDWKESVRWYRKAVEKGIASNVEGKPRVCTDSRMPAEAALAFLMGEKIQAAVRDKSMKRMVALINFDNALNHNDLPSLRSLRSKSFDDVFPITWQKSLLASIPLA